MQPWLLQLQLSLGYGFGPGGITQGQAELNPGSPGHPAHCITWETVWHWGTRPLQSSPSQPSFPPGAFELGLS